MDGSDAFDTLLAFYRAILEGDPRPRMTWRFELASSIRVRTDPARPPGEVRLWRATNREARDFRLDTLGARWESSALTSIGRGIYVATVEEPARGWTAFFVEATYPGRGPEPLKLTTAVRIVPDTLPFPPPGPEPRGQ
jgi:PhoPQ-activated pathogenicity-related protein